MHSLLDALYELAIETFEATAVAAFLSLAFTLSSSAVLVSYVLDLIAPFVDAFR